MTLNTPRNSTAYVVAGTKTFRLASRAILEEWGGNLQNIEKSMRSIYIPDDGYKFGQRDQSGAEALVVAYLAPAGNLRELFKHNIKPHTYAALHLFKRQWESLVGDKAIVDSCCSSRVCNLSEVAGWNRLQKLIKKSDSWESSKRYYFIGKKVRHARSYGMGVNRLVTEIAKETGGGIAMSKEEGQRLLDLDDRLFPEIRAWQLGVEKEAKETGMLRNLFGFPWKITGPLNDRVFKSLYSIVPQSTVGTISNIAFTRMYDYIEAHNKDWAVMENTHDSFLCQFPDTEEEEKEWLRVSEEMLNVELVAPDGSKFQMKSEAATGYNWAPYHETKNPRGLKEV